MNLRDKARAQSVARHPNILVYYAFSPELDRDKENTSSQLKVIGAHFST
jgi:hypothetical protein